MPTRTVQIHSDDWSAELVMEFTPPAPYRWNEPPDGGEVFLPDTVRISGPNVGDPLLRTIPLAEFLPMWMEHIGSEDPKLAERRLEDDCFEDALEQLADEFDDRDE